MNNALIDKWFHSFRGVGNRKQVENQGQIVGAVTDRLYLVHLRSWIDGDATTMHLRSIEEMKSWDFYETSKDMNYAWETKWRHINPPEEE